MKASRPQGGAIQAGLSKLLPKAGWAVMVLIALVIMGIIFPTFVLSCSRVEPAQVNCIVQTKRLGHLSGERMVTGLQGASVDEDCGDGCVNRIQLDTVDGSMLLTPDYTCATLSRQKAAERINEFFQDTQKPSFEIEVGSLDWSCPWPFVAVPVGGWAVWSLWKRIVRRQPGPQAGPGPAP